METQRWRSCYVAQCAISMQTQLHDKFGRPSQKLMPWQAGKRRIDQHQQRSTVAIELK
jgi:hypothetical protein